MPILCPRLFDRESRKPATYIICRRVAFASSRASSPASSGGRASAEAARAGSGGEGKQLGRRDAVATWGRRSEQGIDFGFPGEDRFATSTICVAVLGKRFPAL